MRLSKGSHEPNSQSITRIRTMKPRSLVLSTVTSLFALSATSAHPSLTMPLGVTSQSSSSRDVQASNRASELMALARRAVSRSRGPESIVSVTFVYRRTWDSKPDKHEDSRLAILLPDYFLSDLTTIVHVVDGDSFHQSKELPDAIRKIAEENARLELLRWKFLFLFPLPSDATIEYVGQVDSDAGREDRILLRRGATSVATLGLDSKTHLPSRLLFPGPCGTNDLRVDSRTDLKGVLLPTKLRFACSEYRGQVELLQMTVDDPSVSRESLTKR